MTFDEFITWASQNGGCGHSNVVRWNEDGSGFCDACGERVWRIEKQVQHERHQERQRRIVDRSRGFAGDA